MRAMTFAVLAVVALSSSPLVGQPGVPLPAVPGIPPQYQEMMATMAAAQGAAMRPGDDALSCEALQAEQQAVLNSAAMQAYAAAMQAPAAPRGVPLPDQATGEVERPAATQQAAALAAAAAARVGAVPGASGRVPAGIPSTPAMAPGAFPGVLPNPALQAQMLANAHAQAQAQLQAAAPVMPLLARQQQVIQLAFLKQCAWVTEAGAGVGVPGLGAE